MANPALIVVDIQREYFTPGRPFYLSDGAGSLEQARAVLGHARANGFNIVHVQHLQDGAVFNKDGEFGRFVEGFEPEAGEHRIVKSQLAAYTNPAYGPLIDGFKGEPIYVMGYGSSMCCLATIVTGASVGHRYTLIADASWARSPGGGISEDAMHRHMVAALGIHGSICQSDDVLNYRQA
ncbi:MAG: isochorismatase family protein [Alphaproteobacteria bacterium]|nr:isochorismatase family protein [Alphaproteobacteria bacterium]